MKNLLFTYGILQNRGVLVAPEYAITATMYDTGSYPAIGVLGRGLAIGTLILVSDWELDQFDIIEGCPNLYRRESIETEYGIAYIYLYNHDLAGLPVVTKWGG